MSVSLPVDRSVPPWGLLGSCAGEQARFELELPTEMLSHGHLWYRTDDDSPRHEGFA
jgi:hypothetical protein